MRWTEIPRLFLYDIRFDSTYLFAISPNLTARLTRISGKKSLLVRRGGWVRRAVTEWFDASNLDDEQLQVAIRVAHNNLKDRKGNFNEFLREGAHDRVIQYSYLHLLFAHMIVTALDEESAERVSLKTS